MSETEDDSPPAKRQRVIKKSYRALMGNVEKYVNRRPDVSVYVVTVKRTQKSANSKLPSASMY